MIPERFEYLFLLLLYFLAVLTLLREPALRLLRKKSFWLSCVLFCATWTVIEICGLRAAWWIYSPRKLCGVSIVTVPLEEYIVFFLIHISTSAMWTILDNLYDVA